MKPGIPWSVKGIEPDAREAAKDAARRRGMTLGAWLNTVIMEQSDSGEAGPVARDSLKYAAGDPDTQSRLDELAAQLAELSRQDHQAMASRLPDDPEPSRDLTRVLERIDATERETVEALSALNDRLADLGKEFAHSVNLASFMKPEDVPGYPALEGALRNVIDHIATSEARAQESLKSMQERLADIASRASPSASESVEKSRSYVRLEERLGELATRIARTETAARQEIPPLMSEELAKLSDRIESVRLNSDAQLQRAIAAATQAVQKELREVREVEVRMQASLAEAQAEMRASARAGFEDQQARAEIEGLSQRFDDLKADAASERDIHSLRVAVEQISARVAQGADFRPLAEMEKRLGDISDRLERASEETLNVAPQMAELEQRIASLDQKLMKLLAENGEINAWPAIEPQLNALVDRLGQTETQLSNLANLDQSIGQLFERVEESRNWSREVADEAANRMAARLSEMQLSTPLAPAPEVNTLSQGLDAIRANSASVDKRNQETFAAIHDALAQVIARLNDGEWGGGAGKAAAKSSSPATSTPMPETAPVLQAAADLPAFSPPHIPPLDSFAPEPARPLMSPLVTPMPDPEWPEPELPGPPMPAAQAAEVSGTDDNLPADDFIAAARRAAQAASHQSTNPFTNGFLSRGKAKSEKKAGAKLSWRLGRKKPEEAPASESPTAVEVLPAPPGPETGKRRRLLIIGIVLLAAASALAFGTLLRSAKKPPAAPAASSSRFIPFIGEVSKPATVATQEMAPATLTESKPKDTIASMVDALITAALPVPSEQDPVADAAPSLLPDAIGTASLRKAALDGNALAQFVIASRFLDGDGVTANAALAAEWFRKAADQDLAPAQYRLGTLYERGKGLTRNMAMARDWYERAAEGGNVRAMHNAAVIYAGAQAGTPGYQKAARWFEAAAGYGLRDSQFNLAILYERGLGVEKNPAAAMFWYGVAARQSDPDAAVRAKAIAGGLSAAEMAETQARIDSFQPKPMDELANRVTVTDADWQAPGSTAAKP